MRLVSLRLEEWGPFKELELEFPDGLIGIVSGGSAEVKALVDSTNAQRLAKYQAIAAKNGTAVDQVQAVAGQKLIAGTPGGEYIMSASGSWQKK